MSFLRSLFAFCVVTTSLTLLSTNAFADSFLQNLEGTWKGRGTLQTLGKGAKKEALACRIKATYIKGKNSLAVSGRCGAAAGSSRFQSTLKETSQGKVSGKPILQRGDLAKISLSGRSKKTSLKLTGANTKSKIYITFILQGGNKFQSQSGLSQAGKKINSLVINWKKQ